MLITDISIPTGLATAHIAHAGRREGRAIHLIVSNAVRFDRLNRRPGDALCRPAARFAHLACYRLPVVPVSDICPRCLVLAVKLRLLSEAEVRRAEQDFAAARLPHGAIPSATVVPPWAHLPAWGDVPSTPLQGQPPSLFAPAVLAARARTSQPEPLRTTMGSAWFVDRLNQVKAGQLFRSPVIVRRPQPASRTDRIVILPAEANSKALIGRPLARLGPDLVVSISAYDIAICFHRPSGIPAGGASYPDLLAKWHAPVLTDQARFQRRTWRVSTAQALLDDGISNQQIADWMFETLSYIRELAPITTNPSPPGAP